MYFFTAIERFDPGNGDRWVNFTRGLGRTDLKRIITLDTSLCPTVIHPESANDWQFVAKEEFMLDFFTDADFVLQRIGGHRPSTVVAIARDPSREDIDGFPLPDFEFGGFDVVDIQFTGSALFNNRFPGLCDVTRLSQESGLLKSQDRANRLRDTLHRRYPDREDANCYVWAVWFHTGTIGNGA